MEKIKKYFWNNFIAVDQLINTVLLGDPDETISSRCAKKKPNCKVCKWMCKWLDKVDPGHCKDAIEADEGKDAIV